MRYIDKCVVEWKYRYRVSSEIYVGEYRMNTVHTDMNNNYMTHKPGGISVYPISGSVASMTLQSRSSD